MKFLFRVVVACASATRKRSSSFSSVKKLTTATPPGQNSPTWGSQKNKERKLLEVHNLRKCYPEIESQLAPFRAAVKEQGDIVRKLKQENAPETDIQQAIAELKHRKNILEDKELSLAPKDEFDRSRLEDLLIQRFFYLHSFDIYGGVNGLTDFGPLGCAMKVNLLQAWRNFFILEEQMLEVETAMLTPEPVLKASGHVDRFQDYMVKDLKTGDLSRADHLIKDTLEKMLADKKTADEIKEDIRSLMPKIDGMSKDEMAGTLRKYNMKSPLTNNDLSDPIEFNLMFSTSIGPTGQVKGYLRPETSQGIFVNFKQLLEFNQGKLPFAAAQIGNSFRNEITPKSGLLRLREFTIAEIEYFCHPDGKNHPKFTNVADLELILYSACNQMDGKPPERWKIGDAVKEKLVANESLGYFIARIYQFMVKVGVDPQRLRFRQHLSNEMAHYACDCWDAECKTSYGWVECAGCADRSSYDLTQHTKATNVKLVAEREVREPRMIDIVECQPQKSLIRKAFRENAKVVSEHLVTMDTEAITKLEQGLSEKGEAEIDINGKDFVIKKEMVEVKRYQKTIHVEEFVPSVIEPSFGIGRIMYVILEHNFKIRKDDEQRTYLSLPPIIAPYKCSVLPLGQNPEFEPFVKILSDALTQCGVSHKVEEGKVSIGRRYARTDQIAIPYGITVDFDTLKEPHSATLRERETMMQIRVPIEELSSLVRDLTQYKTSWDEALQKYPIFKQQASTK